MRLRKVYVFWVLGDFGTAEQTRKAGEEQGPENGIEISIDLTAEVKEHYTNSRLVRIQWRDLEFPEADDALLVEDVGVERDAITSLRAPTYLVDPNWDRVVRSVRGATGLPRTTR